MDEQNADYAAALSVIRRLRGGWSWSEIVDGEAVWWRSGLRMDSEYDEEWMTPAEVAIAAQIDGSNS